jgi:hypothetical protein
LTFSKAAAHATNFTVGHETKAWKIADWDYPDNHIEIDGHLVIAIPILKRLYPDATWIHLIRNKETCVASLAKLQPSLEAFSFLWFQQTEFTNPNAVAAAIYETYNGLCEALLPNAIRIYLETAKQQWADVWRELKLTGDYEASLKEWDIHYNASEIKEKEKS